MNFIKCIFYDCGDYSVIFVFHPADVVDHIYWFVHFKSSLHLWDEFHLIMVNTLFIKCSLLASILLRICASMFSRILSYLCRCVLFWFLYQCDVGLIEWIWKIFESIFWNNLQSLVLIPPNMFGGISQGVHLVLYFLLMADLLLLNQSYY